MYLINYSIHSTKAHRNSSLGQRGKYLTAYTKVRIKWTIEPAPASPLVGFKPITWAGA